MVTLIGGIKGGTGKTTLATNYAVWLSKKKQDVLLIDSDDQETATDFTVWRKETLKEDIGYTAVKITGPSIVDQVRRMRDKYDHIIIDSGGRDTSTQRAALFISDISVVPFQPRTLDFWTINKLMHLIKEVKSIRTDPLQVMAFLNRADTSGSDNIDASELLKEQESIEFIDCPLVNRKAYANAAAQGLSVIELAPVNEKANAEIESLFQAILKKSKAYASKK